MHFTSTRVRARRHSSSIAFDSPCMPKFNCVHIYNAYECVHACRRVSVRIGRLESPPVGLVTISNPSINHFFDRVLLFIVCPQGRLLSSVKNNCFLLTPTLSVVRRLVSIVFNQYISLKRPNSLVIF